MLLRLDSVEEVGRFAKLNHHAEPFSRLSLIFARNGYGKSTISAILRSATENEPNYIAARRRLGATKESRVQTTWAGAKTHAFAGGSWKSCPGKAYVFDEAFVRKNVHVDDGVTRENKRNLLPLVLGEEGVGFAETIIALDTEQRDLDRDMKKDTAVIRAKCPIVRPADLPAFCTKDVPADVDKRVESAERRVQLAKQTLAVQQKALPRSVTLASLDHFREVAARTVESVSKDVADKVRQHMDKHQLAEDGERWLRYGLDHSEGGSCPFCDQAIDGLELIHAYNTFFSDAFNQLISDRDLALGELDKLIADGALETLVNSNGVEFLFWGQVCDLPSQPTLAVGEQHTITTGLAALRDLLAAKLSNPLQVVELGDQTIEIEAAFEAVASYNEAIAGCATAIDEAKASAKGVDLQAAQDAHERWLAFAAKQTDPIKTAAADYAKAEARRKAIGGEKEAAQAKLTSFAGKLMKERQKAINELLENFGANFSIVDARANFKGRIPNTDYAIAIGGNQLAVGESSETEPSFQTVLSAGDKTTLALAFFITQVWADPKVGEAVVVFDDPFSSQDVQRQFETTSQIRAIANGACQTLVLSHDPRFLHMIEGDADPASIRMFQLLCADDGTGAIKTWSSAEELKALYVRQGEMIREYANQGKLLKDATLQGIVQAVRPFLEDYIRARFPGRFGENEQLFPMIEVIEATGKDDPLYHHVDDMKALNEYTRPNMHGGGQVPEPGALRAQCKRVMKIVGSY